MTLTSTNAVTVEVLEDATPERLAHANDNFIFTQQGARQFQDSLIDRMFSKGQLYPNGVINLALYDAGKRYHSDWHGANMDPLAAIDYGKVGGGSGGSGSHMPASHMVASYRSEYRKAREALGKKYREPLELILLQDQDLVGVGRKVAGVASPHACRAVAVERFTAGLYLLAKHYGFLK